MSELVAGDRVMLSARHLRAMGTRAFARGNLGLSPHCKGKGTLIGFAPRTASIAYVLWDEDEINGIARGINAGNLVHVRDVAREANEAQHSPQPHNEALA